MTAFDWNQFLVLAVELSNRTEESALRSAISRAYYCVYHIAKARTGAYRFSTDTGSSHEQLWDLYARNDDNTCKEIALIGNRLRLKRVTADYRAVFTRIEEVLPEVLKDAKRCLNLLSSLHQDYPKPVERTWSY